MFLFFVLDWLHFHFFLYTLAPFIHSILQGNSAYAYNNIALLKASAGARIQFYFSTRDSVSQFAVFAKMDWLDFGNQVRTRSVSYHIFPCMPCHDSAKIAIHLVPVFIL